MNLLKAKSRYLQKFDCLLVDCNLDDYLIDYYLNAKEMEFKVEPAHDEQLKQFLACLAIHLTTRPPGESIAWTVHMQSEIPYSLFLTGDSSEQFLVGRILYDNVTHTDMNVLHSQVIRDKGESSRSTIRCESFDVRSMFETFYQQSEQLDARFQFIENSDKAVCLFAMPGSDKSWFEKVDPLSVIDQIESYDYKLVSQAGYRFYCDCSSEKLLPFLRSIDRDVLNDLYQEDRTLLINCPRCGKRFEIEKSKVVRALDS